MKHLLIALVALPMLLLPGLASASSWSIDPAHSYIGFRVRHMMVTNVFGTFDRYSAKIVLDDKAAENSRIEVAIETASVNTNMQKRDEHLRSADFLDVANHPSMTFVARNVSKSGDDRYRVAGDLTLRGVTRPVVLVVEGGSQEIKDPWGNIRRGASATTTINRKEFGLNWNAVLESGGVVVGDEVTIILNIELIKNIDK